MFLDYREDKHKKYFSLQIKNKSDIIINYILVSFYLFGLLLAFYYDTWLIAFGVGGLSLVAYYSSKIILPHSDLYQYTLSIILGVFMAQFIYQMHGMFEMHFFAFIGSTVLITYQNWKLQIPLALFVVVHHALFAYLQYAGFEQVYFTQLEYMSLQTFVIHGILATIIFAMSAYWAYSIKQSRITQIQQSVEIGRLQKQTDLTELLLAERKQAEESIAKSEKLYRQIVETAKEGICLMDENNRLIFVNNELCEILGYSIDEMLGKEHFNFINRKNMPLIKEKIKRRRKGISDRYELPLTSKNGEIVWTHLSSSPILSSDGLYTGSLVMVSNITELKNTQTELENMVNFLEVRVMERTKELKEKNINITDSILYAKRLQTAILAPEKTVAEYLPDIFILYKPKDIISGDFYWIKAVGDLIFIAAADSTGHGVPGSIVAVVCNNALNRSIDDFNLKEPGKILDKARELVLETFSINHDNNNIQDGMDISLCSINKKTNEMYWSGANNPLLYIQENELIIIKAHKQPVAKIDKPTPFPTHKIQLQKGNTIYLITDGFTDQFGGEKGKKYKRRQLEVLLLSTSDKSMSEQKSELEKSFDNWKGDLEQVDDVCIIGIKI